MYLLYVCVQQMIRATAPNCERGDEIITDEEFALMSDLVGCLTELKKDNNIIFRQGIGIVLPLVQKHMSEAEINVFNNRVKEFTEAVKGYNGTDRAKLKIAVRNVIPQFATRIFFGSRDERAVKESVKLTFAAIDKTCKDFALVRTENDDSNKLRQAVQSD